MVSWFRRKKADAPPVSNETRSDAPAGDAAPTAAPVVDGIDATAPAAAQATPAAAAHAMQDELPGAGLTTPAAAPGTQGWRDRLRGSTFARSFGGVFSGNPRLDDALLDDIETALITADVGVAASTAIVEGLRKRMKSREFADAGALLAALRADLVAMLLPVSVPLRLPPPGDKPFVLLTVGVNGVGKTTTIGKLARRYRDEGRSLMLAAGDTFRAAAVAQLQSWGERHGVAVVAQGQNADPAAVAFDALQAASARGTEVLITDTAGRLHTQVGLMNELGKIKRVLQKLDPSAPHEVLMVIDGTAKGGVVFALAREFGIPIRYAGIGERPEDLRVFDAEAFVDALLPDALGI